MYLFCLACKIYRKADLNPGLFNWEIDSITMWSTLKKVEDSEELLKWQKPLLGWYKTPIKIFRGCWGKRRSIVQKRGPFFVSLEYFPLHFFSWHRPTEQKKNWQKRRKWYFVSKIVRQDLSTSQFKSNSIER